MSDCPIHGDTVASHLTPATDSALRESRHCLTSLSVCPAARGSRLHLWSERRNTLPPTPTLCLLSVTMHPKHPLS